MPNTSIQAAAEGMPFANKPFARAFRRFANRCRAAITTFRYAGLVPQYLVVYERTGLAGDDDGHPMCHFGGYTPEDAVSQFAKIWQWTRELGGECERPRIVMVVGNILVRPQSMDTPPTRSAP